MESILTILTLWNLLPLEMRHSAGKAYRVGGLEADLIAAHSVPARWPVPDRASGRRVADMAAPSTGGVLAEPPPEFNFYGG